MDTPIILTEKEMIETIDNFNNITDKLHEANLICQEINFKEMHNILTVLLIILHNFTRLDDDLDKIDQVCTEIFSKLCPLMSGKVLN
jgi:hypothetical protein